MVSSGVSQLAKYLELTNMNNMAKLIERDLQHIWHPCSQMKDYESFPPLAIKSAKGSYIELVDGRKIIDAISSWWCKSLGHNHPCLKQALLGQLEKFEHVIFANTSNETIVKLSERLTKLAAPLNKVFYAGDGSCAVEVAMKMSLHLREIEGDKKRSNFLALENGYHGETLGALSVSDLDVYKKPYKPLLFDVEFVSPVPYVSGIDDPLWNDCSLYWSEIESDLNSKADNVTALILEPILQGAGGMKIYSKDFLRRLRSWSAEHKVHFIADEIMTGISRTGKMLACDHAEIRPDILCLSKGLTSGWLPFSAILTTDDIYNAFYDDYETGKSFLHSHTFSGNVLAASVALATLTLFEETDICRQGAELGEQMLVAMQDIANTTKKLTNVRSIGTMVAADLLCNDSSKRVGYEVYRKAVDLGALLRPLGNTIYWLPPLNMGFRVLEELAQITRSSLLATPF